MSHTFIDKIMEKMKSGELISPVEQLVGMRVCDFGRGTTVYELPVKPEHANPMGVVQGGIASILADAAMAMAATTTMTNDQMRTEAITTVDLFSRFMRPVKAEKVKVLRAEARVVRSGRFIVWLECDLLADGEVVAKFSATGSRVSFDQKDHAIKQRDQEEQEPANA